jgi:DNA-directed RNA polymerase subunit RPC12/RpoP
MAGGDEGARQTPVGNSGEVTLLVCMTCGREYQFEAEERPAGDLTCEKCGSEVFRRFDDAEVVGEARAEFQEETGRDLATSDPEGEATRGDLHDLNP